MKEEEGGFVFDNLCGIRFYCLDHAGDPLSRQGDDFRPYIYKIINWSTVTWL